MSGKTETKSTPSTLPTSLPLKKPEDREEVEMPKEDINEKKQPLTQMPPLKQISEIPVSSPTQSSEEFPPGSTSLSKSDTTKSVEAVSKDPSSMNPRCKILAPKDSLTKFDDYQGFKEALQQALHLPEVTYGPVEENSEFIEAVRNTDFIVYTVGVDDRFPVVRKMIDEINTIKDANPNVFVTLLIVASSNAVTKTLVNKDEMNVDDVIIIQRQHQYDITGLARNKVSINKETLARDIQVSLSNAKEKALQRLS
ncbi:MAG: hypothetical protein HWD61_00170 [Parachlamydiaceae bacterium]|nr:MAG: hypothetical protein HWD61_00170 [Parachlamydiaceae bacterium]